MRHTFPWASARCIAAVIAIALSPAALSQVFQAAPGSVMKTSSTQSLEFATVVALDGKVTAGLVKFFCNPYTDKTSRGMLGFEIHVQTAKKLAPFRFDDFEGPDAAANGKKLVTASLLRAGTPPQVFTFMQSGWYATGETFAFGVADESQLRRSPSRNLLETLQEPAERLQIVIADPRNPKRQLSVSLPLAGQQGQFKALLAGLK